jgi:hypothetical protein
MLALGMDLRRERIVGERDSTTCSIINQRLALRGLIGFVAFGLQGLLM